ncbi:hypothetical protein SCUCBS95973_009021, partial [Sporothrix curviconia]
KTTVDIARAATFEESSTPTLVYAKGSILDEDNAPLSLALENFMRFENRFFKQELKEESPRGEKKRQPAEEASPTSPLKRHQRQRSTSIDSMASNMASLGDDSSYGAERGSGGYMAGMDLDMENVPLLNLGNNERFPLDSDEAVYGADHTRPFSKSDVHDWTLSQTLEHEIEVKQQEYQSSQSSADISGMDMIDVVLPQREIDTPVTYDIAAAGPLAAAEPSQAVSADSVPASTAEPETQAATDIEPGPPTPEMSQMAIDADNDAKDNEQTMTGAN